MALAMSRSSIDALGRRLAKASTPSADDLAKLAALQRDYAIALDAAVDTVRRTFGTPLRFGRTSLGLTPRVKTPTTLIDKLRRGTSLSSVQDVVGFRIVGALNLKEQDDLTARLSELFPDSKVVDRRRNPMHGYRAVHVIARYSGVPIEVQIRTRYQQAWADATERLADSCGPRHPARPAAGWARRGRDRESSSGADQMEVGRRSHRPARAGADELDRCSCSSGARGTPG